MTETTTPAAHRIAELRKIARTTPSLAQAQAWQWLTEELSQLAARDRDNAWQELHDAFRAGSAPPADIDGDLDAMPITIYVNPFADWAARLLWTAWRPWRGFRIDAASGKGYNRMSKSLGFTAPLIPQRFLPHKFRNSDFLAATFEGKIVPGKADPDKLVYAVDYYPTEVNGYPGASWFGHVYDEFVEILPKTYLAKAYARGKAPWTTGDEWRPLIYYALRQPV
jgi:hypothetical protein